MRPPSPPLAVTAYWVERSPDGNADVSFWPEAQPARARGRAAQAPGLVLVNDLALARSARLLPAHAAEAAMDLRDLFALAVPVSGAEDVPQMLAVLAGVEEPQTGPRALAEAWPHVEARFRAWPAELLELVVQLLGAASGPWSGVARILGRLATFTLGTEPPAPETVLLGLVRGNGERAAKRELPDPEDYQSLHLDDVARWLEPGGPCARVLDGYEHRAGQVQMTRAVAEAFNTRRHLVVEAGTGVGKSVAYLLPAILWALRNKAPVVVSTNTKNLQTQLFQKDIPTLRHVLTQPFRAALIKGRMNYACLRHVIHILEHREAELTEDELPAMAKVVAWLAATATGDLDELDRVSAEGGTPLLARLPATGEECGGRSCRYYGRCLLQRARALSLNADVVVANHSLVFAESKIQAIALPKHAHVVFDEAHNLEESATRHFTREISSIRFAIVLRRLWRGGGRRKNSGILEDLRGLLHANAPGLPNEELDKVFELVTEAIVATDAVRQSARRFLQELATLPRPGEVPLRFRKADLATARWSGLEPPLAELRRALVALHETLEDLLRRMKPRDPDAEPAPPLADALRDGNASLLAVVELADDLDFVTTAEDADFVHWLDVAQRDREPLGTLCAAPVDIAERLVEDVFDVKESVILCSATLSVNGSFQFLAHRIGLDRLGEDRLMTCQAASPFDYAAQCRVAAPVFLPDPADIAGNPYPTALAAFLVELMRHTHGRTLVLFTSYEMLRTCAKALAEPMRRAAITLLVQGEGGSRDRLTRIFRHDIASVLLGTDSFWEGVDVMGESLSCVVIARLPFDAVKDPLVSARGERVAAEGGDPFRNYALPNAIIKFRQGFGRLIRHRSDRGWVIVTDRRIQTKSYGVHFRRNLPCAVRTVPDAAALYAEVDAFFAPSATGAG